MRSKAFARVLALTLLAPPLAPLARAESADDRAKAKALIARGSKAYEAGDYGTAASEFRRAYELFHSGKIFFNIAQAELKAKHDDAAAEAFAQFLTQTALDTKLDTAKVAEAKKELAGLRKHLAWATLTVKPEGARVTLDGREVSPGEVYLPLQPADHEFRATAPGYQDGSAVVKVAGPGKVEAVNLELKLQAKVVVIGPQPETPPAQPAQPAQPKAPEGKDVPLVRPTEEAKPAKPEQPKAAQAGTPGEQGGTHTLVASAEPTHAPAAGGVGETVKPAGGGGIPHLPAYVAWGVAVASAGTALGTGVYSLSLSNKTKNDASCAGAAYDGCYKRWHRTALATDILWGVAGAAAVTGGVLFFVTPGSDGSGGEVGVQGHF